MGLYHTWHLGLLCCPPELRIIILHFTAVVILSPFHHIDCDYHILLAHNCHFEHWEHTLCHLSSTLNVSFSLAHIYRHKISYKTDLVSDRAAVGQNENQNSSWIRSWWWWSWGCWWWWWGVEWMRSWSRGDCITAGKITYTVALYHIQHMHTPHMQACAHIVHKSGIISKQTHTMICYLKCTCHPLFSFCKTFRRWIQHDGWPLERGKKGK